MLHDARGTGARGVISGENAQHEHAWGRVRVTRKLEKQNVSDTFLPRGPRLTEQSLLSCHAKSTFKSRKVNILDRSLLIVFTASVTCQE